MRAPHISEGLAEALAASAKGVDLVTLLRAELYRYIQRVRVLEEERAWVAARLAEAEIEVEGCDCPTCRADGPSLLLPLECVR